MRVLAAIAAALLATGCVRDSSPGIIFATDPPGALVYVNGTETGFATPCAIELDRDDAHRVEFRLEGYETEERRLTENRVIWIVPWSDGEVNITHWRFPLWLPMRDFVLPVRFDDNVVPNSIFVPLRVATED